MKYPQFLNKNSKIGVVALSAGVGDYIEDYKKSLLNIESRGFEIIETASVRNSGEVSNTAEIRAKELDRLITDYDVELIMCATGGDFLIETLPYLNLENINNNPKWLMGASDPTSILYLVTTALDIATIYGFNACSFDQKYLHDCQKNAFEIMKGNIITQNSFELYELERPENAESYNVEKEVYWETLNGDVDITGRIIGGCVDCLKDLPGTRFDYTKEFIEKYKEDGIIWYFDIFSLTSEAFYLALIQLKESGWFKYVKEVIAGRVRFPGGFTKMTYQEALKRIFKDIPIIFNADIGHVAPKMTIINGSIAHITSSSGKGKIDFRME
ncbi:MAG: LD-carboxypeptidase [Bacilli bacterium]|nr:LD-carboxypeptidase [Bacilli bacterium]